MESICTQIGYVAGIKYNSEGKILEWLYGKNDLVSFISRPHVLKTIPGIKKHIIKMGNDPRAYYRPYHSITYV